MISGSVPATGPDAVAGTETTIFAGDGSGAPARWPVLSAGGWPQTTIAAGDEPVSCRETPLRRP
jgi:hypothetical protein